MCAYISLAIFFYYTYLNIMYLLFHKSYISISIYLNQII